VTIDQEHQFAVWMSQAQRGDALAYADLLSALVPLARRYVRGKLGERMSVEDVVQEALLSLHRARHTYDARRPFAPWFYAILSNRMIDVVRRERRTEAREEARDVVPDPGRDDPHGVETAIDVDRIRAAVAALPDRQREVVTALKLHDESVRDIGARLGMKESAVKVTAHRGYRALRRMLGARER
jgi:RNA polymerase sigma-70 factor (ECF subfamily)